MLIPNPVTVMGTATFPFEGDLEVWVWDDSQLVPIAQQAGIVTGDYGQCGSYAVEVGWDEEYTGTILIQVFTRQPFNGQLRHLSSTVHNQQP